MTGRRKHPRVGRPSKSIREASEFGRLVEQEMAQHPDDRQARIFDRIRRRDPRRWKSERTMFRLWKAYRENKPRRSRLERRRLEPGWLFDVEPDQLTVQVGGRTLQRLYMGVRLTIDGSG